MFLRIRRSSMHREHCGMNEGRQGFFVELARLKEWASYVQHGGCGGREQEFMGRGEGRGPRGFGGFGRGPGGFGSPGGFGPGRGRLFDAGDVKLVILKLLSEQPSYGYQLIKTMEERLAGGYTPSAGVIYPTLTLLEEEGLATSAAENNKKVYSVTPEGLAFLEAN